MKNPEAFFEMMECTSEKDQISHYKINKPLPETLTIEDIISDMKKSRFQSDRLVSEEELQNNRQEEFERVSRTFSAIQKAPADYTTEKFLNELQ